MVLVIDNYDSFTYNLVQYLGELGADIRVRRNNQVTLDEIGAMAPAHIVISPGPGEIRICSGAIASISPIVTWLFRRTRTSAPSSPRYCTRL